MSVRVIAEAGVNHNGSIERALRMVDAAAEAGADVVKFQTFDAESLVAASAPKAAYQLETTGAGESQLDMIRALQLTHDDHLALLKRCEERGVEFLSAPFDLPSIDFLRELGLSTIKVPSGAITDLPFLRAVGATGVRLIVSTGMATLDEVAAALCVLRESGTRLSDITLLHCTTEYPTPLGDVNLLAMRTLAEEFGVDVGYSDHTEGIVVPIAAVALGAQVIEKHFTLDRSLPGPDHRASLDPAQLAEMVGAIRSIEAALGDGIKRPAGAELGNVAAARKSIVAAHAIKAGQVIEADDLTTKRPGTGVSPMRWDDVVGSTAARDYERDELIEP